MADTRPLGRPRSRYEILKDDTDQTATWLRDTASAVFKGVKLSHTARQNRLKNSSDLLAVTIVQPKRLMELVDIIADEQAQSSFALDTQQVQLAVDKLSRCISLRRGQSASIRSRQDMSTVLEAIQSNLTHDFFTDSLQYVKNRLKSLLPAPATSSDVPPTETLTNFFDNLELFTPSEKRSSKPAKGKGKAAPSKPVHVDPENKRIEALVCLRLLLQDIASIRDAGLDGWKLYINGDMSLAAVALTHNTCIDFARILEQEAKTILDGHGGAMLLLEETYVEQCKAESLDPSPPKDSTLFINPFTLHIADSLMIVSKRILEQHLSKPLPLVFSDDQSGKYKPKPQDAQEFWRYPDLDDFEFAEFIIQLPSSADKSTISPEMKRRYTFQLNSPRFLIPALDRTAKLNLKERPPDLVHSQRKLAVQDELSRGLDGYCHGNDSLSLWLVFALDFLFHVRTLFTDKPQASKEESADSSEKSVRGKGPSKQASSEKTSERVQRNEDAEAMHISNYYTDPWQELLQFIKTASTTYARSVSYGIAGDPTWREHPQGGGVRARYTFQSMRTQLKDDYEFDISQRPGSLDSKRALREGLALGTLIKLPPLCGLWQYVIGVTMQYNNQNAVQASQGMILRFAHAIWLLTQWCGLSQESFPELLSVMKHYDVPELFHCGSSHEVLARHLQFAVGPGGLREMRRVVAKREAKAVTGESRKITMKTPLLNVYTDRFNIAGDDNRLEWSLKLLDEQLTYAMEQRDKDLERWGETSKAEAGANDASQNEKGKGKARATQRDHRRPRRSYAEIIRDLVPCLDHEMAKCSDDINFVQRMSIAIMKRIHAKLWPHLKKFSGWTTARNPRGHHERLTAEMPSVLVQAIAYHHEKPTAQSSALIASIVAIVDDTYAAGDPGEADSVYSEVEELQACLDAAFDKLRDPRPPGGLSFMHRQQLREMATRIWYAEKDTTKRAKEHQFVAFAKELGVSKPVQLLEAHYALFSVTLPYLHTLHPLNYQRKKGSFLDTTQVYGRPDPSMTDGVRGAPARLRCKSLAVQESEDEAE